MGCSCRKPKRPAGQKPADTKDQEKAKGKTQSFSLRTRSGNVLTYGSKLEAEAANARQGGTGTVTPRR